MSQSDQPPKVTLEDLLRLKRAERPSPDFWSKFERELREKQLTALVQKRRWWHELPVLLSRRVYLPAGAAAIVAFTVVTVRYSVPGQMAQTTGSAPHVASVTPAVDASAPVGMVAAVPSRKGEHEETTVRTSDLAPDVSSVRELGVQTYAQATSRETEAPAARPMVANLSRLGQSESEQMDALLGSKLSVPARLQPAVAAQSEVASLTPASSSKYQLIARYVGRSLSPAPAAPAVVRERLARRLEEELGDSISRIGVVGSKVSLKF